MAAGAGRQATGLVPLPAFAEGCHCGLARRLVAMRRREGRIELSALNLAAARLRYIAGTAWSTKRYLNIELLKDQQMRDAITA